MDATPPSATNTFLIRTRQEGDIALVGTVRHGAYTRIRLPACISKTQNKRHFMQIHSFDADHTCRLA